MRSKGIKLQHSINGKVLPTILVRVRLMLSLDGERDSLAPLLLPIFCLLLASCSVTQFPVPVFDRAPASQRSTAVSAGNVKTYTVQKGDTLYGIALNNGLAYKDLAEWNSIGNPNAIDVGQQLNLSPPPASEQPSLFPLSQTAPSTTIETPPTPRAVTEPRGRSDVNTDKLKTEPKAFRVPYSEQTLAQLKGSPDAIPSSADRPEVVPERVARINPEPQAQAAEANPDVSVEWVWPTQGKLLEGFSEGSKGVDIAGKSGQAVLASAPGKVVYSGNGLRGYGNLIIIKHNDTYLSAYAHNSKLLMKEGQVVTRGQKIAEMGSVDAGQIKLHFEIRKHGKPVDPLQYLPAMSK